MASQLFKDLKSAVKTAKKVAPWDVIQSSTPYIEGKHRHGLRAPNTLNATKTVRLYYPILNAAWMYAAAAPRPTNYPYRLVKKQAVSQTGVQTCYILEAGLPDDSSLLFVSTKDKMRISHCETDGTRSPIMQWKKESLETLSCTMLTLIPHIIDMENQQNESGIKDALETLSTITDTSTWHTEADILEAHLDAMYYTDIIYDIFENKFEDMDFGPATANEPAEIEDHLFLASGSFDGELVKEYLSGGWEPKFVHATGVASMSIPELTIGEAKSKYSFFGTKRNWSQKELEMIEKDFPDDMPVMEETIMMAEFITSTSNDTHPARNGAWTSETSYGKSFGVKQLSCILYMPLLVMPCSATTERQDFLDTFAPNGKTLGVNAIPSNELDLLPPAGSDDLDVPFLADAVNHMRSMSASDLEVLLNAKEFCEILDLDLEGACELLLGRVEPINYIDLSALYINALVTYNSIEANTKIAALQECLAQSKADHPDKDSADNKQFLHVVNSYARALNNGYIVEVQEFGRIKDSGVLVGLNEYNHPGAIIELLNGMQIRRHKDAITVWTDNPGYISSRPVDQSVIRRMDWYICSGDLPKDKLKKRVMRNVPGCSEDLFALAYDIYTTVKDYCRNNAITDGSCSPTELEKFIQMLVHHGPGMLSKYLDIFIINKAATTEEDRRDIRSACATLYSSITV